MLLIIQQLKQSYDKSESVFTMYKIQVVIKFGILIL